MFEIHIITAHPTASFAAEELKKYLRMMMPRCGAISIRSDPTAESGFRLGLMQDFGLELPDIEDAQLDDVVYLCTNEDGGIIAGSNPAAMLIAVYRYLRFCGCRWLLPGTDGEWIPVVQTLPTVNYRKKADHRYRGMCNEGAEFQRNMLEVIDFVPKIGLNTFMLEFDIPSQYYQKYYQHSANTLRRPEPVTNETILQWKRQCETEIERRGLHFHDMGHGWTAEPFGIASNGSWASAEEEVVPPQSRQYLAKIAGERKLYHGVPLNTNICYSNPEARRIMVQAVADYAQAERNVDFLHIWLADDTGNHCECKQCREKRPADWYVLLLNEIDEELTHRNLDTRLVFIAYTDTFWPPLETQFKNEKRFTMLYAPIHRVYTESYGYDADESAVKPFVLNQNEYPRGMAACLGYLKAWKRIWHGDCFCYEYHFFEQQYHDPTGIQTARSVYNDIQGLEKNGLRGMIEDGSQRSFFPNGFAFWVYGETLFDKSVTFESLVEDYFSHAYGESWRDVLSYLQELSNCFDILYMTGRHSVDAARDKFYNPEMSVLLSGVIPLTERFRAELDRQECQPHRAASVCWQLLRSHQTLVRGLAETASQIASGNRTDAIKLQRQLMDALSAQEVYLENYFDLYLFWQSFKHLGLFRPEQS